jgi:solute carrier family 39 (zinc transporter), member 5
LLSGDGIHNFTDGLAIGAAFSVDIIGGMAISLAVLLHELPHELGDIALLLKTGMGIKRAMYLNLLSSVISFIGMIIGLLLVGYHAFLVRWIYAATAGIFMYIALCDLLPEISEGAPKTFKNNLLHCSGILLGGLIMLAIAEYEDALEQLFAG